MNMIQLGERENMNEKTGRSKYRVVGPNTSDYRQSTWFYDDVEEAKKFALHMAGEVDATYDIFQYIGSYRQTPLPVRPIEFIEG